MAIHKGSELSNVSETWNQNERNSGNAPGSAGSDATAVGNDLNKTIREEAAEYDNANREDRTLEGERASVRDDRNASSSGE